MKRNFESFKEGFWYVYTGDRRENTWNERMDFALEHKPIKCIETRSYTYANFKGFERGVNETWGWAEGFDNWIEITDEDDIIKNFDYSTIDWKEGDVVYDKQFLDVTTVITRIEIPGIQFASKNGSKVYNKYCTKQKFKVGDIVEIVGEYEDDNFYSWDSEMEECFGRRYKIEEILDKGFAIRHEARRYSFENKFGKLVENDNEFKVGDRVEVYKTMATHFFWKSDMNEYLMKQYYIHEMRTFQGESSVRLKTGGIWFPIECIRKVNEIKPEFNIGDRVKVVKKVGSYSYPCWIDEMDKYIGNTYCIKNVYKDYIKLEGIPWGFSFESLERVNPPFDALYFEDWKKNVSSAWIPNDIKKNQFQKEYEKQHKNEQIFTEPKKESIKFVIDKTKQKFTVPERECVSFSKNNKNKKLIPDDMVQVSEAYFPFSTYPDYVNYITRYTKGK